MKTSYTSLKCVKTLPVQLSYLISSSTKGKTWILIDREKRLVAIDADTYQVLYTLELPGVKTSCMVIVSGDLMIVNRYIDKVYTILALRLKNGQEVWRAELPVQLKYISKIFLHGHAETIYAFINTHMFRLERTTGELLEQHDLPSKVSDITSIGELVYVKLKKEFGRITADGNYTRLLDTYVFQVICAHNQVYCWRRNNMVIFDAMSGEELARLDSEMPLTDVSFNRIRKIAPLPNAPHLLGVVLRYTNLAAVIHLQTRAIKWMIELDSYHYRPDGFATASLTPAAGGLLLTLYSVGSDEEISLFCDIETGQETYFFDAPKGQYLSTEHAIIESTRKELNIYEPVSGPAIFTGYLTLTHENPN